MKTGTQLILRERERQIHEEGWTPEHDDEHDEGELAMAAICYAAPEPVYVCEEQERDNAVTYRDPWPVDWSRRWDKRVRTLGSPVDPRAYATPFRISQLTKAGALIAAEIDRLQRAMK